MYLKRTILLSFLVVLSSPWFWKILSGDVAIACLLIGINLTLVVLYFGKEMKLKISLIVLLIIVSILNLRMGFNNEIWVINHEDVRQINHRHIYYAENLGKLYNNKVSIYFVNNIQPPISKYLRNLFYNLDPNQYFFTGHPRERSDAYEFGKYLLIFLPFFILGVFIVINKGSKLVVIYLITAALISGFVRPSYFLGPLLFFPVINSLIVIGLYQFFVKLKNLRFGNETPRVKTLGFYRKEFLTGGLHPWVKNHTVFGTRNKK